MACSKMSADDIEILLERTPVDALNVASRRILSDKLKNNGKLVELGDGSGRHVCDNYTGIAELENFHPEEIKDLSESSDPVESLVSELAGKECTVGHLRRDLINMGRRSIVKMSHANWVKDCVVYEDKFENTRSSVNVYSRLIPDIETDDDIDFDKVNLGHTKVYDAFLSFAQGDFPIAKRIIQKVEKNKNFSLFVPGRDDLPGGAKHVLSAYVIEKRCRRVIIVLTREFRSSPECDFQVRFANALDPGAIQMKIIPVICERNVEVPRFLNFIKSCDITKNEWQSLYKALSHRNTQCLERITYPCPAKLNVETKCCRELDDSFEDRRQPEGQSSATNVDQSYEIFV